MAEGASEVDDGACLGKPVQLSIWTVKFALERLQRR